ncbi:NfeD family protein [Leptolyngbya sp. FACHB-36]|uniref:NfeD family protein n=1 Tax=Leptolyngbya sp. FACHB-36 TaxID=2692808 RepID=UPI00168070E1|nr:NfeD family protein [Leptolyngbya sp. FACHB-36]MBD2020674.1 NfeD family protein [Leptolyngbya sp. FACHB-36]
MSLSPTEIWLLVGLALCLAELLVPTAFVAFVMGLSALAVAAIATKIPLGLQVVLWMGLSLALVLVSRRFVRYGSATKSLESTEAETLTEIEPGKPGRVLFEGNSWAARCEDSTVAIAPNQRVIVVARRGTTLIVMPETALHS